MKNEYLDIKEVKDALSVLKDPGEIFEIRILKGKTIISGYFNNTETLEEAFKTVDLRGANVFYTLNELKEGCYSRVQRDCFRQVKTTTSDGDVECYRWLLVDLDPVRMTGISSTKEEGLLAYEMARRVVNYLRDKGFPFPIMARSGNGIHLLYRIKFPVNDENIRLVERCLKALDLLFTDDRVAIDTTVYNPSRISKLYGTLAQKGASTKERPHRMAQVFKYPAVIDQVSKYLLEELAKEYPEEQPKVSTRNVEGFNLEDWISEHGIKVEAVKTWKDATRYILSECPFDSSHKAPDATLIKMSNGAICFKCLHNSCAGRDWHEFRLKYEPDAYDDKRAESEARIEAGWKQYKAYNRKRKDISYEETSIDLETEAPTKMFNTMAEILALPKEERVCIPTGMKEFDRRVGGLAKGEISLISGLRGAAKSTLLSQMVINAVDKGFNTIVYSGELKRERFVRWMAQQAAGKDHVEEYKMYIGQYYCKPDALHKISDWMGDKFHLYDNEYGSNFRKIAEILKNIIREFKADFVVIDNMSILDLTEISSDKRTDKWDQQKLFVETLKNLSMICNCHIIFAAHPRKAMGFLRLDDVGGSGSLGNLVDDAFIMHRNNTDFKNGYKVFSGKKDWKIECSNIIEVVKERESGFQGFIPLWYEAQTRRLKNEPDEKIIFGWDDDGFAPYEVTDEKSPF